MRSFHKLPAETKIRETKRKKEDKEFPVVLWFVRVMAFFFEYLSRNLLREYQDNINGSI